MYPLIIPRQLVTVNTIAGYRVNNHFIAGIGAGANFYNGGTMIPLYLDFRYKFNQGKVTPFFVADGGVLFDPKGLSSSGLFINPAFGIAKKLNNKVSFHISGGLWVQEAPAGSRNSFLNIKGRNLLHGEISISGPFQIYTLWKGSEKIPLRLLTLEILQGKYRIINLTANRNISHIDL